MIALLEWVGWNTLVAFGLSLAVLVLGRVWKRPELLHVLWVVVLVKLVTPGMVRIEAIPRLAEPQPVAPVRGMQEAAFLPAIGTIEPGFAIDWGLLTASIWLAGTALLVLLAAWRVRRFVKALRVTVPAEPALLRRIEELAAQVGIDGPRPRVRMVDAAVSPMVWCGIGGSSLILPSRLMRELDEVERDTLLAHELAHLKRGDCWIRWLELAVTSLLWWNPVVWWVRRQLRRAEEQACDRRVIELFPRAKRAYADGIVKAVEFLAGSRPAPVLAIGAVGTRQIEERLTMILTPSLPGRLRRPLLPALLLALFALPVVPGFAERDDDRVDEDARAQLIELEREALQLERQLYEIQMRRAEVEQRLQKGRVARESADMKLLLEELRREGAHDEAARVRDDLERIERRVYEETGRESELMDRERAMREAELEFREALIGHERAVDADDEAAIEAYEKAVRQYERQMHDREMAMHEAEIAYEKARQIDHTREVQEQIKAMMEQQQRLTEDGRGETAAEVREQIAGLEAEMAGEKARREYESQHLMKVRQETLQQLEKVGAAMGHAENDRRRELEIEFENLSRKLKEIDTELGRSGTLR